MRPQTIVERLDFVAKRVQGLKFTPPTQLKPGDDQFYGCFMSCDMYYIEIKVDQSHQSVKDVIISHGNNADGISCPVLRRVLADQDFETFAKHLTGLHSIYQINTNDKKVKQRAYPALTALEADLTNLYDHQRRRLPHLNDLVHKSPIGFMEPRKGGLPVKLTYFITPYDLVDTPQKTSIPLTSNNIIDKNLGLSATVEIEGSSPHKIQIKSLIAQHNSSLPSYVPFSHLNSEKLPAQFVLKLSQPFPMLNTSISQIINEITEPATIKEYLTSLMTSSKETIISLIARQELDLNKGPFCRTVDSLKGAEGELSDLKKHVYFIRLPDQNHTYHMLDNYLERPDAVYVTKIPFTHPTSIPTILKVLRLQAQFNFMIGSCIRRNKGTNSASNLDENASVQNSSQIPNIFDVLPVSLNSVCVSFEHPSKESLATLELNIKDITCQLHALDKESVCSDEFATKVLQKCWSIPITLRSVLKKCNERRLALLEDSNKRRERELQELLANNSSTQQGLQVKPNLKYQDTVLQSKLNEKSTQSDLNSIAEFLTSKVNNANLSDNSRQIDTTSNNSSNRTNLLKKFSCKPKVKQNTATKGQIGNKILSQMLKRQNSAISIEDPHLRGPVIKRVKTKLGESTSADNALSGLTTTKLITPEIANAARLTSKQNKQGTKNQNISLSLIRSPNKSQSSAISSSTNSSTQVGLALTSNQKQPDSSASKIKLLTNGGSCVDSDSNGKPRKSSINAVIDRLVCEVNPDQQAALSQLNSSITSTDSNRNADSSKITPNGPKSRTRTPGGDQFAIKQGSSGGGLKLTVTKTKPSIVPSSSTSGNTMSSAQQSSSATTTATSNTTAVSIAPSTSTSTNASTNPSSSSNDNVSMKQSEANKIIDLGSTTPSIRYTIPKISKTQQASQSSSSNANSSDNSTNKPSDTNQHVDDSNNPSSSGNSAPSSTTTKRTTSNPFIRNGGSNRNPVSSSTHPPNRTTSNPLANIMGRPSSTSSTDNHIQNRITSTNNGQNQPINNMRQTAMNRPVNLLPQTRLQPQPQFNVAPRFLNAGLITQTNQASVPMMAQPLQPQMFALRMPQHANVFSNPADLNMIAANQVALLNQQQQQIHQFPQQPTINQPQIQQILQQQVSVTSSSDSSGQDNKPVSISQPATSSSTPSSPTECNQVETVAPPPLIPIDSLHEARPASPDEEHDDASDRLSIVDMVELADGNSSVGTPKPSDISSPMEIVQDSNCATSSSTPTTPTVQVGSTAASSSYASTAPIIPSAPAASEETGFVSNESVTTIAQGDVQSSLSDNNRKDDTEPVTG